MNGKVLSVIAVATVLVGLSNLWLNGRPLDLAPITPTAKIGERNGGRAASDATIPAPATSDFAETFDRPLFSPDRRRHTIEIEPQPVPAALPPTPPTAVEIPVVTSPAPLLLGISITGQTAQALLKVDGQDQPAWHRYGDTVAGWTIAEIGKDRATLQQNGQTSHLLLYPSNDSGNLEGGSSAQD
ncbi:hypothetical protein SLT36_30185 (plasmid) [Aminobacter sp. BA135]|uniref:hypothetical protein n=1 Tax=Aminobacter sp. BA135 TaxID=537596 RepID=UPI003D7A92DE